ncbi:methyl-accepting chemotaxis protein [Gammaproteobacteria bacterium]
MNTVDKHFQKFSHWTGYLACGVGTIVLLGWLLDIPTLKSFLPGLVSMKANTALGFVLVGVSLLPFQENYARTSATLAGAIGFLTLCEYLFGWNLKIDQLLFEEPLGSVGTKIPGRMGFNTALSFLLLGSSLLLIRTQEHVRLAQSFSVVVFLIALLALLGYGYGVQTAAGGMGSYTTMALHTALFFLLTPLGVLFSHPKVGIMGLLVSTRPGGSLGRRLLPLSVLLPILLGWLCLLGMRAGMYEVELSLIFLVLLNIICFSALLWPTARSLNLANREQQSVEETLRQSRKELVSGIATLVDSSSKIFSALSQVASGAAQIATAVSETSTTAEEVKQTAHLSHQKAKNVQETARKAAVVSQMGTQSVSEALEGMHQIRTQMEEVAENVVRLSEQGQAIAEIIETVNDLTEQSNLLAVNAAIEASRAGEYGKGFVVLAQEVKSLAHQSRQATKQVRSILMEVQKATVAAVNSAEQGTKVVASGVQQASKAGESIRSLESNVAEAAQAATQIAASSQQQLIGMDQIAIAIANIRQATQKNMLGAKELETSAHGLQELGMRLQILVGQQ